MTTVLCTFGVISQMGTGLFAGLIRCISSVSPYLDILPKLVTIVDLPNENNKDLCVYFTTD
jgi:hypothetical protein